MRKLVRKRLLIGLIIFFMIVLMVSIVFLVIKQRIYKSSIPESIYCKKSSDCEIQPTFCGCFTALNKNVEKGPQGIPNCIVKLTNPPWKNKSEIEEDPCPWKLETTFVECIKNRCTLVEVGK